MIEILAQASSPSEPSGWFGLAIQGGIGTIAVIMLKWMMKIIDTQLKEVTEGQERMRLSVTEGQERMRREISESNDRNGRGQLMLILAMHQVDEALKNQARALIVEMDDAQKARDKGK